MLHYDVLASRRRTIIDLLFHLEQTHCYLEQKTQHQKKMYHKDGPQVSAARFARATANNFFVYLMFGASRGYD